MKFSVWFKQWVMSFLTLLTLGSKKRKSEAQRKKERARRLKAKFSREGDLSIPLKRTSDILAWLGANRRDGQVICGFSMETRDMVENSRAKLHKKNVDMICANNLKQEGAGFGVDTNIISIITREETVALPLQSKQTVAHAILDKAIGLK